MSTDPCTECGKSIEECEAHPDCCGRYYHPNLEAEKRALQDSPIACKVADAWVAERELFVLAGGFELMPSELHKALERLELVTRPSAMRKVRP